MMQRNRAQQRNFNLAYQSLPVSLSKLTGKFSPNMCNGMCNQCKELEGGKMRNVIDADSFPGLVNYNLDKGKFI